MKLAQITAAIAIATSMAGAFAAPADAENATEQTTAATAQHQWYQAGDRELQSQGRSTQQPQGLPQPGQIGSDY